MTLLKIFVIALAAAMFILYQRIRKLEDSRSHTSDLLRLVKKLTTSVLGDDAFLRETNDIVDALNSLERIGRKLSTQTPALRRVLEPSISLDLDSFLRTTSLTLDELNVPKSHIWLGTFTPLLSLTIEEWGTHTVVWDISGRRKMFYPRDEWSLTPRVLWHHYLPMRPSQDSSAILQVVLHDGSIKFWGLDGHFGRPNPWESRAKDENVFVTIPIYESKLSAYRLMQEPSDDRFPDPVRERSWIRHYAWGKLDKDGRSWQLTVTDVAASIAD